VFSTNRASRTEALRAPPTKNVRKFRQLTDIGHGQIPIATGVVVVGYIDRYAPRLSTEGAPMLVLSRQRDESIIIGDDIVITIVDVRGDKVRLGISAPPHISVHRKEIYEAIQRETGAGQRDKGGEGKVQSLANRHDHSKDAPGPKKDNPPK
jgi:carbon storage regulator